MQIIESLAKNSAFNFIKISELIATLKNNLEDNHTIDHLHIRAQLSKSNQFPDAQADYTRNHPL